MAREGGIIAAIIAAIAAVVVALITAGFFGHGGGSGDRGGGGDRRGGGSSGDSGGGHKSTPAIVLDPRDILPIACGTGNSCDATVTVTSDGTADLHVTSIDFTGPQHEEFAANSDCTDLLPPGETCTITVHFNAVNLDPNFQAKATMHVHQNLRGVGPTNLKVVGTGYAPTDSPPPD
ncbi:hypothetical protein [Nonomuraea angiospora]